MPYKSYRNNKRKGVTILNNNEKSIETDTSKAKGCIFRTYMKKLPAKGCIFRTYYERMAGLFRLVCFVCN